MAHVDNFTMISSVMFAKAVSLLGIGVFSK